MRNYLFLFCLTSFLASGCSKTPGSPVPPGGGAVKDVYMAGYQNDGTKSLAQFWKNGAVVPLTDGSKASYAFCVAVSGSDVFVSGFENNDTVKVAKCWKNGVAKVLPVPQSPVNAVYPRDAFAYSLSLSGNDVYAAGGVTYSNANGIPTPLIWKNGDILPFSYGTDLFNDIAHGFNSIAVAGGTIYLAGHELGHYASHTVAKYWKKKDGIILLESVTLTDGSTTADAYSIAISGSDVYVAGYENNGTNGVGVAKYWKNGVAVALTDGSRDAAANAVVISGNDVYVAGYENNGNMNVAKYWKNGVALNLTDGNKGDAEASAIAVSGSDVYVVGYEFYGPSSGRYWKNGVVTAFEAGVNSEPLSIALGK